MAYPGVDLEHADEKEHRRLMAQALNGLLEGQSNNGFKMTLTPGGTGTLYNRIGIAATSVPVLTPMTASAAQALAAGTVWATVTRGALTIHHGTGIGTDLTFGVALIG